MADSDEIIQQSTFVSVVAWIFIVVGGFASLIAIAQNIMIQMMFTDEMRSGMAEPSPPEGVPSFMVSMTNHIDLFFFGFLILCLTTFVSAVGLLKRKNWARIIFVLMMSLGAIWNIGGTVTMAFFMDSIMPADVVHDAQMQSMMSTMMAFNTIIGLAFGGLFGWIAYKLLTADIRREFS